MGRSRHFNPTAISKVIGLARLVRPDQWYKQVVILFALFFSQNLFSIKPLFRTSLALVSFCALAGCVYAINDVRDREHDRNHPVKRNRPVASGLISPRLAVALATVLLCLSVAIGLLLGPLFVAVLGAYVAQNAVYTVWIKRVPFADVITIAIGFVFRAVAGVIAIDVYLSPWLVLSTFLLALMIAIGKRHYELTVTGSDETRSVLQTYTPMVLRRGLIGVSAVLLATYSIYSVLSDKPVLLVSIPTSFVGVWRFYRITVRTDMKPSPLRLLSDRLFSLNLVMHTVIVTYAVYF